MSEAVRARQRVFHVTNRGSDSESSDEEAPVQNQKYSLSLPPQTRPGPPLTTNISRGTKNKPERHSPSSPSSASSPAVEDTPPPSTPGVSGNSIDLTADDPHIVSSYDPPAPRPHMFGLFKFNRQPKRPSTSPTVSTADDRILILVTADSERYVNVEITGARSPAFIRECVFTKLNIYDEEDQARFSIYQTEIGAYATSEALSDDRLFELCRTMGDGRGTLKFLVSHSSATVHEQPLHPVRPLPPVSPPCVVTIPPPVLPEFNTQLFQPLRPNKRNSGSRREGSISSASEQIPMDSPGYDADLDNPDRDNRSTMRPPTQQVLNSLANAVPPSPLSSRRSGVPLPSRPTSPPPSTPPPYVNVPPPPPLSPNRATFPLVDDNSLTPPARHHVRSGSDAASERERTLQQQPHGARDPSSARPERRRQRSDYDDHSSNVDSWVFIKAEPETQSPPQPISPPPAPPSAAQDYPRASPSKPRTLRNQVSPTRYNKARMLNIPPPPRGTAPAPPGSSNDSRIPQPLRATGHAVPPSWAINWKGESKAGTGPESKPSHPISSAWIKSAKSVDSLRAAFHSGGSTLTLNHPANLRPGRQAGASSRSNSNVTFIPTSGSYKEGSPMQALQKPVRPLPMHNGASQDFSSASSTSSYYSRASPQITSPSSSNIVSPDDPYPRPRSAMGDGAFPKRHNQAQSPIHALEPSFSMWPTSQKPMSPTSANGRSAAASHPERDIRTHSPTSPQSPRIQKSLTDGTNDVDGNSDATLRKEDHPWLKELFAETKVGDATLMPPPRLLPDPSSASSPSTTSTSPPKSLSNPASSALSSASPTFVGSSVSGASTSLSSLQPSSLPSFPAFPSSYIDTYDPSTATTLSTGTFDDSDSDDLWNKPLGPVPPVPTLTADSANQNRSLSSSPCKRPPLTVQIENIAGVVEPVSVPSAPGSTPGSSLREISGLPSSSTPTPNRRPSPTSGADESSSSSASGAKRMARQSTFLAASDSEGWWAPRPLPEDMYEKLDQYFPEHDLDKPVIEAASGGTSPTNATVDIGLGPGVPPLPPLPMEKELSVPVRDGGRDRDRPSGSSERDRSRIRAKKSIRIVAQEHKKKIDRTSMYGYSDVGTPNQSPNHAANMLRKRSTKLWGSKLEEVTTDHEQVYPRTTMATPDSPSAPLPTTFKWVRGELIGRGTYGRVYLALNATTGEMIAVKQVEIPQTASDKNDSRQIAVVQALKSESETLKDLDHPNIVQYLGFEETPSNLSIFLEYVPGGSIGSVLLKHGKFAENVTKSFTGQILSGLEYLHSKGILHRDLKADNILVEMTGVCKISDFGISKRTADDAAGGGAATAMQGTVFWMAPEVINPQGKVYNAKIDIWSVGCVVLEMWAGMRPWSGDEMVAVMFKLWSSKLPPPVPEGLVLSELADDLRRKCFAINPDERPSAAELRKHKYLELPPGWVFNGFT
ncbi:hypothetical protein BDP27DRAFT_1414728 [Rhodocollybia butyracea]|uniref:Protein kinase domain-containing protein n=1 Tax=Rhodocollybia butyracea TaxID=206335 RepID=A0A9P5Q7Q5_9AGAR|nr:hypothetical protein BDP27DRAFT_1414728 [Rhodocollybia butyracea]